jgi:Domain of unknown function (DUF5122) beta-propeller
MKAGRRKVVTMVAASAAALAVVACVPPTVEPPSGSQPTVPATGGPATTAGPTTPTSTTTTTTTTTTTVPVPTVPSQPRLYSPTPLNGWGISKDTPGAFTEYVDVVEIVGNTVYVGGDFANAVKGPQTAPRANFMAVNITNGDLLPFLVNTNGPVTAMTSDGTSLFIGGDFTSVNGVARTRLAKINLATGAIDPTFVPTSGRVDDMVIVGSRLYIVGEFNTVNGQTRTRAAAVNTTTGALDPTFKPLIDARVMTVAASPDGSKIYIGGNFLNVNSFPRDYMAEISPVTGEVTGPDFDRSRAAVLDLQVSPDGSKIYGGTRSNIGVQWNVATGDDDWFVDADGDTQAILLSNGYVYQGFHDGFLGDTTQRVHAVDPATGAVQAGFRPASSSHPGVWTLDADGRYLVAGGYFANMGGVPVKGLAIFPAS